MNYYNEIKGKLINNEIYGRVKDYSKERNRLLTYYEVGKLLSEAGKHYGKNIAGEYSKKLVIEVGKKYSSRLLYKMIKYYNYISNQKVPTMSAKLTCSHYDELLALKIDNQIEYYSSLVEKNNLTIRQLRERIKSKEYERLPDSTINKLIKNEELNIKETIKNPIIIRNPNNKEIINEKGLQLLILENIVSFLKELGEGFTFIENEYKIKIGDRYNYIDLLLFNIEFNCYVVVELKVTELKKEHIGQIEVYMNYIDNNLRRINQDKTIGIIICKKDNKYILEYCSDSRVLSKEYKLL